MFQSSLRRLSLRRNSGSSISSSPTNSLLSLGEQKSPNKAESGVAYLSYDGALSLQTDPVAERSQMDQMLPEDVFLMIFSKMNPENLIHISTVRKNANF
jgi:hypothetical protein